MTSSSLADLLFIAFMECLQHRETSISLSQLHTRNFTPHPQLTRDCVCLLVKQGRVAISYDHQFSTRKKWGRELILKLKISGNDVPKFIIYLSQNLKKDLIHESEYSLLTILDNKVKTYECIAYCRFYLAREGMDLSDDFSKIHKLQLMLLELAQEQVFMLLWRAVKTASKSMVALDGDPVPLNKICDLAYKYFIDYRMRRTHIAFYRAPYTLGYSAIRNELAKLGI